jgi:adenylate kinase
VIVAFIGPVGAGKTTQARRFARALPHYNPRLSSGELVRAHIEAGTELGRRMRGHYDRGEAVPDEMLLPLILPSIRRAGGWILDNFPASVAQAGALDAEQRFDEFLVGWPFERDDPAGVTRLAPPELGVRVHSRATGLVYHLENDPPPRPEENLDPGPFERREDDAEEAIRHLARGPRARLPGPPGALRGSGIALRLGRPAADRGGRRRRARSARAPGAAGVLRPGSPGSRIRHEEFAERAAERLEAVADRLEEEGHRLGVHGAVSARAGEMRLAALLTREEARTVTRAESEPSVGPQNPPLEAQA